MKYRQWLERVIAGDEAYGVSDIVLSGFLRVVTHPGIFTPPNSISEALVFVDRLRTPSHCVHISPGPRHWEIFTSLLRAVGARGNLVPDAFFAALAIESGSEWITTDRAFSRFPGLRWRHPLDPMTRS